MADELTPEQAAQVLSQVESFHQVANGRSVALTWMLWALAWPLALFAMGAGGGTIGWSEGSGLIFRPLWGMVGYVAVLAAAGAATGFLWHAFAVRPETRLRPAWSLAWTAVGLTLLLAVVSAVLFASLQGWIHAGDTASTFQKIRILFVLGPNTATLAGLWLLATSFGPWLGSQTGTTRGVGAGLFLVGLLLNALPLLYIPANPLGPPLLTIAALGGCGVYHYKRG